MPREKIRVSLHSFDSTILDEACKKMLSVILLTERKENINGPIPLPTRKRIYCVLRSPHVDKDSREQFEIRRYKRIIDIYPDSVQTFDAFLKIELPPGVSFDVQISSKPTALQ